VVKPRALSALTERNYMNKHSFLMRLPHVVKPRALSALTERNYMNKHFLSNEVTPCG